MNRSPFASNSGAGAAPLTVGKEFALGPGHFVERTENLASRSRIRNRMSPSRSPTARFRACCVTQVESGFLDAEHVHTPRPDLDRERHVERAKPSSPHGEEVSRQDRVSLRNWLHDGPVRRGAGPSPCRRRSDRMAVAETRTPSFGSSPRILT